MLIKYYSPLYNNMASFKDNEKHLVHYLSTIDPNSIQHLENPGRKRRNAFLRRMRKNAHLIKLHLLSAKQFMQLFLSKQRKHIILFLWAQQTELFPTKDILVGKFSSGFLKNLFRQMKLKNDWRTQWRKKTAENI